MKKIVCLAVSLTAFAGFAQNSKSVEFTKKLSYKYSSVEGIQKEYDNIIYNHYIGKNNKEAIISTYYNDSSEPANNFGKELTYYFSNNWIIPVTVNGISQIVSYEPYSSTKSIQDHQVIDKINRQGNFNGVSCQYYAILSDVNNKESYEQCFCIDENNKINNAEAIFLDSKIKGLVLSMESKSGDFQMIYQAVENVSLILNLDTKKMLADIEEYHNSAEAEVYTDYAVDSTAVAVDAAYGDYSNIYNDPLYTYNYDGSELQDYSLYTYISPIYSVTISALYNTKEYSEAGTITRDQVASFYKKEAKSLMKNLKSAKIISADQKKELDEFFKEQNKKIKAYVPNKPIDVIEDTAEAWAVEEIDFSADDFDYSYYTQYQSEYNTKPIDEVSLAYDILHNDSLKQNAPEYCEDLKNKIPNFQNASLSTHVHNLTGQICDLYLYNNGGLVDYLATVNSMRKSYLEIEKLRNDLSKKDQQLLLEFLKTLD